MAQNEDSRDDALFFSNQLPEFVILILINLSSLYRRNHEGSPLWAGLFRSKGKFGILKG